MSTDYEVAIGKVNHDKVWRHSSKFHVNCALFDTSVKFGTLIVVTGVFSA